MSDLVQGFLDQFMGTADHPSALERLGRLTASVLLALLLLAIAFVVAGRVRLTIHRYFAQRGDLGLALLLGRTSYFLVLFVGLLMVLRLFGLDPTAVFAALGVLGLAVSLAMQDVLKNVFAGIYLLVERPFRLGETIKVRDFTGTVESINLRTTTLAGDEEHVYIPNAILFSEVLVNRGRPAPAGKPPPVE